MAKVTVVVAFEVDPELLGVTLADKDSDMVAEDVREAVQVSLDQMGAQFLLGAAISCGLPSDAPKEAIYALNPRVSAPEMEWNA